MIQQPKRKRKEWLDLLFSLQTADIGDKRSNFFRWHLYCWKMYHASLLIHFPFPEFFELRRMSLYPILFIAGSMKKEFLCWFLSKGSTAIIYYTWKSNVDMLNNGIYRDLNYNHYCFQMKVLAVITEEALCYCLTIWILNCNNSFVSWNNVYLNRST